MFIDRNYEIIWQIFENHFYVANKSLEPHYIIKKFNSQELFFEGKFND